MGLRTDANRKALQSKAARMRAVGSASPLRRFYKEIRMTKLRRKMTDPWVDIQAQDVFTSEGGRVEVPQPPLCKAATPAWRPNVGADTMDKHDAQPRGNVRYRT